MLEASLGLPERYLQCGRIEAAGSHPPGEPRHHCGRFGHNAFTPAGFTDLGALAQSAQFDLDLGAPLPPGYAELRAAQIRDTQICTAFYPPVGEIEERYRSAAHAG